MMFLLSGSKSESESLDDDDDEDEDSSPALLSSSPFVNKLIPSLSIIIKRPHKDRIIMLNQINLLLHFQL